MKARCCVQACESPLLVAVAAGSIALPTLLKLATVMAGQNQDFQTCTQLPVVSYLHTPWGFDVTNNLHPSVFSRWFLAQLEMVMRPKLVEEVSLP